MRHAFAMLVVWVVASAADASAEPPAPLRGNPDDFGSYLAVSMTWYIEWPHVDASFSAVFSTLPGYSSPPFDLD
jgi:hypothetical protein